jgi:hypothetical protein
VSQAQSDLLPELQGRLPIRVELKPLDRQDLINILNATEASLIRQYVALMATEGLTLHFTQDAIEAIADAAVHVNSTVENIGARRLSTIMERLVEDISFDAPDKSGRRSRSTRPMWRSGSARWRRTRISAGSCCRSTPVEVGRWWSSPAKRDLCERAAGWWGGMVLCWFGSLRSVVGLGFDLLGRTEGVYWPVPSADQVLVAVLRLKAISTRSRWKALARSPR